MEGDKKRIPTERERERATDIERQRDKKTEMERGRKSTETRTTSRRYKASQRKEHIRKKRAGSRKGGKWE
jgi:hypothetical protein